LLNGSSGIAVGMTSNIPPHHLGSTLTATINLINNSDSVSIQNLQGQLDIKNQQIIANDFRKEQGEDIISKQLIEEKNNILLEEKRKIEENILQLKKEN
jgi:hypothetical protein